MKQQVLDIVRSPRVLILVAPFVLMAPVWLTGHALYWGTPSTQFVPWWWQAWQTLRSGELPLWNPLVGMGAPLLANYQSALLYPPTWIYFGLAAIGGLPLMAWGQGLLVALHLAWAGWGMGLVIRRLGKGELAQTVGGLAFGLSGYLVARAHFLSINAAVAWLPWILLMAYEVVHEPQNKKAALKLALVLALQWLAGHAQIAWYSLVLAIAWTSFWSWRAGGWRGLGNSARRFGVAGLLAFCLSAAQLLPTAEYLVNSQRATQVDFAQASTYSFWPWRLIGLVVPNFFGNPAHGDYWGYGNFWEDAIYIGVLPFALAVAALWWGRKAKEQKPFAVFLLIISVISFLLALGSRTPLFGWLYQVVPTFALFQSPTRFTIWLVVALALLAGLAADQWTRPIGKALYRSRLAVAGALALLAGSGVGFLLVRLGTIVVPQTFFSATLITGAFALAAVWLHLRAPEENHGQKSPWSWLVGGLVAADLLVVGWGLNPGTSLELYKEDASLQSELREQLGEGRLFIPELDEYQLRYERLFRFDDFYSEEPEFIRTFLLPNTFLLEGISSVNNYDPLVPARYKTWMDVLNNTDLETQLTMLRRMGVAAIEKVDPGAERLVLFESIEAVPHARWVNCAKTIRSAVEVLSAISSSGFDPRIVMIERSRDSQACGSGSEGSVKIRSGSADSVEVLVDAPGGGWLVLAETFFPGWRAFALGKELTIYPADGLFRAVQLEVGKYELEFVYQPMWFYSGAGLSILSWLGLPVLWRRDNRD
ncbi:MAG: YfhO family protein [Chloroflexi bacterium]|nr:YfhO family protein [Chloroflexota bacterium]